MMKGTLVSLAGLAVALAGCTSPSARTGEVVGPRIGSAMADFTFVDLDGKTHPFSGIQGEFKVLAFTKCAGNMHSEASKALSDMAANNQQGRYARTVVFDVHWSPAGCAQCAECRVLTQNQNLYSLCDAKNVVEKLYNAEGGAAFVLIGPDRHVLDTDTAAHRDAFEARLHRRVAEHAEKERMRIEGQP